MSLNLSIASSLVGDATPNLTVGRRDDISFAFSGGRTMVESTRIISSQRSLYLLPKIMET